MSISQTDPSILSQTKSGFILSGGDGTLLTGSQKLVQRVILELFTAKGSMPFNSNVGCSLVNSLKSNQIYSEYDIQTNFAAAAYTVVSNLKKLETDATPMDERLSGISLSRITIVPGKVIMTVKITDALGSSYDVATLAGVSL